MAKYYITTTKTTYKAQTSKEVYDILKAIDTDAVMYIETYSKRHGYTDVTLKFLVK